MDKLIEKIFKAIGDYESYKARQELEGAMK